MLHLYKARHLEPLADKYHEVNSSIIRPLLDPYPIIVPNMAVGRWLVQYLSKRQGICANLERVMPGDFLWRLIAQMNTSLPERSDFSEEVLKFRILSLLDDPIFFDDIPRMSGYLAQCGNGDKVELAKKIAKVFDQYQIYRNDWLEQWNDGHMLGLGDDEEWQQRLWQQLIATSDQSGRALLEEQLSQTIVEQSEIIKCPDSLCLFGVTSLTPGFIKVIKALSEKKDIHLFAFSCDESMGGTEVISEILSHWKETGHGFFSQFNINVTPILTHRESKRVHHNYLQHLQNVITSNPLSDSASPEIDDSLIGVCCYSPMREVEAVHNYLLKLFDTNKDWNPGDILIALPDLDTYAPYVRAVFDGGEKNIPYFINDSLASSESPLINGLTELLSLPKWRFTREQVMVLLHNRLVQKKFNITDGDMEQIESWLDDAGIRWGSNADHWQEFDLPATNDHTWQAGLDRLLLGFALPKNLDAGNSLYKGVMPADEIESSGSELLSHFVEFCEKLFHWRKQLQQSYSLHEWQMQLQQLINDFFAMDKSEEKNKLDLMQVFYLLANNAQQASYEKSVDIEAITVLLKEGIASNAFGVRLSGSVNIASLSSLASLPFKQVCLLGMNFDSWPSQQRPPGFDLMAKNIRAGDRNRSIDERYLTLQLILSAKEGLYLSYTGRDIHNGEEIPPSVLLSELMNISGQFKIHPHPMHVYSPNNFSNDSLFQSHYSMWLHTAQRVGQGRKSFPLLCHSKNLPGSEDTKNINMEDVLRFFSNPQAYFLRHQLGIFLTEASKNWENIEPFDLSDFADSKVRKVALNQSMNGTASDAAMVTRAMGLLPHGQYGDILQQIEQEKVDTLIEGLSDVYSSPVLAPLTADISIAGFQLSGDLRDLRFEGQLFVQADDLYPYQKIQFWIQHLFLCCVKPRDINLVTRIYALGGELVFTAPENPQELLVLWLESFHQGQSSPLSFYAKVSWEYAKVFNKKFDEEKALVAAKKKWDDNFYFPGENAKPTNKYLYRGHDPLDSNFQNLAQRLLIPLLTHEGNSL